MWDGKREVAKSGATELISASWHPNELHQNELSSVLEGIENPAIVINSERRIVAVNRRYIETYGGPEGVEGRHCFEVSHHFERPCDEMGESCPIRNCRHGEPSRVVHVHHTPDGPRHEEIVAYPVRGKSGEVVLFLEIIRRFPFNASRARGRGMVGRSAPFNRMLEEARRVARRSTPVLLLGETGTGKELLAQAVHEMSERASEPFVPVDCSGISETLFESELFGHEKGAFTGAANRKVGLVEKAGRGTLFLDEVGDIPLPQQVKLLRLLENGTFRRVGNVELVKARFRLICATHRDLSRMVAEGLFRSDLYYRLNVFPIRVPPLRERKEDLPLIARSLLLQVGCQRQKMLAPRTLEVLESYDFKGNVRELRNLVERSCMLADGDVILPHHLPTECRAAAAAAEPVLTRGEIRPLEDVEARYLRWAAENCPGDNRELARRLGISERTLYRKLERLRLELPAEETGEWHAS